MRENWRAGGVGWAENEATFDAVFAPFTEALLRAADIAPGHRVLDVGCGSGTLLAQVASSGASPVGVDISETMAAAARRRVPGATVLVADAQTTDLLEAAPGRSFDRIVSRFGVMFFEDPVAAFANIRSSAAPGATLTFVCWREGENPMFTLGTSVLVSAMQTPPPAKAPDAPGSQSLGARDRVQSVLSDAGWMDITIEALDAVCDFGTDGGDGVEQRLAVILASSTGREARADVEARLGEAGWNGLIDEVRVELRRNLVDGVVKFLGHTWLVQATNPSTAEARPRAGER